MHEALCPLLFTVSLPIGEPWCRAAENLNRFTGER